MGFVGEDGYLYNQERVIHITEKSIYYMLGTMLSAGYKWP